MRVKLTIEYLGNESNYSTNKAWKTDEFEFGEHEYKTIKDILKGEGGFLRFPFNGKSVMLPGDILRKCSIEIEEVKETIDSPTK